MAVHKNNIIANTHFRKWWQKHVRTWFNQAGRKQTRRTVRQQRAAAKYPNPTAAALRPVVRPPTSRYNFKSREGRGFTLAELKKAKMGRQYAQSVGICVDHRRRNHCQETLDENVERLNLYKSKLIVFQRKSGKKGATKGDATKEDVNAKKVTQNTCREIIPLKQGKQGSKSQDTKRGVLRAAGVKKAAISGDMKSANVFRVLRREREIKRNFGKWEKRKRDKAAKDAEKKKTK